VRLKGLGQLKKIHLIGTRTRDHPACSIGTPTNTKFNTNSSSDYLSGVDIVDELSESIALKLREPNGGWSPGGCR
jgi:hypothetical protein